MVENEGDSDSGDEKDEGEDEEESEKEYDGDDQGEEPEDEEEFDVLTSIRERSKQRIAKAREPFCLESFLKFHEGTVTRRKNLEECRKYLAEVQGHFLRCSLANVDDRGFMGVKYNGETPLFEFPITSESRKIILDHLTELGKEITLSKFAIYVEQDHFDDLAKKGLGAGGGYLRYLDCSRLTYYFVSILAKCEEFEKRKLVNNNILHAHLTSSLEYDASDEEEEKKSPSPFVPNPYSCFLKTCCHIHPQPGQSKADLREEAFEKIKAAVSNFDPVVYCENSDDSAVETSNTSAEYKLKLENDLKEILRFLCNPSVPGGSVTNIDYENISIPFTKEELEVFPPTVETRKAKTDALLKLAVKVTPHQIACDEESFCFKYTKSVKGYCRRVHECIQHHFLYGDDTDDSWLRYGKVQPSDSEGEEVDEEQEEESDGESEPESESESEESDGESSEPSSPSSLIEDAHLEKEDQIHVDVEEESTVPVNEVTSPPVSSSTPISSRTSPTLGGVRTPLEAQIEVETSSRRLLEHQLGFPLSSEVVFYLPAPARGSRKRRLNEDSDSIPRSHFSPPVKFEVRQEKLRLLIESASHSNIHWRELQAEEDKIFMESPFSEDDYLKMMNKKIEEFRSSPTHPSSSNESSPTLGDKRTPWVIEDQIEEEANVV